MPIIMVVHLVIVSLFSLQEELYSKQGCHCKAPCEEGHVFVGITFTDPTCKTSPECCPSKKCDKSIGCLDISWSGLSYKTGCCICYDECTLPDKVTPWDALLDIAKDIDDAFDDLGDHIKTSILNELRTISSTLIDRLKDPLQLVKLTGQELALVGENTMAHLKHLSMLKIEQVAALAQSLKDWTVDSIATFIDRLDVQTWKESIKSFGCITRWTDEQLKAIGTRAFNTLTGGLTIENIKTLGTLLAGVDLKDFTSFPTKEVAIVAVTSLPFVDNDMAKKIVQFGMETYGEIKDWNQDDWAQLADTVTSIETEDLRSIASKVIIRQLDETKGWDLAQAQALVDTIMTLDSDTSFEDWQFISRLAYGAAPADLQQVPTMEAIRLFSEADLSHEHVVVLVGVAKKLVSTNLNDWKSSDWNELGNIVLGLSQDDVSTLKIEGLAHVVEAAGALLTADDGQAVLGYLADRASTLLGQIDEWSIEDISNLKAVAQAVLIKDGSDAALRLDRDQLIQLAKITTRKDDAVVLVQAALNKFGTIESWTSSDVQQLSGILLGFESSALADLSPEAAKTIGTITGLSELLSSAQVATLATVLRGSLQTGEIQWKELAELTWFVAASMAGAQNLDENMLENLGQLPLTASPEQLQPLRDALITAYGVASKLDAASIRKAGSLVKALKSGDFDQLAEMALLELQKMNLQPGVCPQDAACDSLSPQWMVQVQDGTSWCPAQVFSIAQRAVIFALEETEYDLDKIQNLGALVVGLRPNNFEHFSEPVLDYVADVACWDSEQLKCLAKRFIEVVEAGKGINTWTVNTWARAKRLIRGISSIDFSAMTPDSFERGLEYIAKQELSSTQLISLRQNVLAYLGKGLPESWSVSKLSTLGSLIGSLLPSELAKLQGFSLDSTAAATLCGVERLHTISAAVLSKTPRSFALSCPDATQSFSSAQLAAAATEPEASRGLSTAEEAGIAIGALLAVGIICGIILHQRRTRGGDGKLPFQHAKVHENPIYTTTPTQKPRPSRPAPSREEIVIRNSAI